MNIALRKPPGLTARGNALSQRMVACWNRRDGVRLELKRSTIDLARRRHLEARHIELCAEQVRLDAQMTRLSEQLKADA